MLRDQRLPILCIILFCLIVMTIEGPNAFAQSRKPFKKYTDAEFNAKYDRLAASRERLAELIKRGYPPKILEEARDTVKIAEEEFGESNLIVIRPLLTLGKLLGTYKYYEEADETFKKVYSITEVEESESLIYAIGYRIRIANLYLTWNKFGEAELTLLKAKEIMESVAQPSRAKYRYLKWEQTSSSLSTDFYDSYTAQIDATFKDIYAMMKANNYKRKQNTVE